jgi:hypothetical protein
VILFLAKGIIALFKFLFTKVFKFIFKFFKRLFIAIYKFFYYIGIGIYKFFRIIIIVPIVYISRNIGRHFHLYLVQYIEV